MVRTEEEDRGGVIIGGFTALAAVAELFWLGSRVEPSSSLLQRLFSLAARRRRD